MKTKLLLLITAIILIGCEKVEDDTVLVGSSWYAMTQRERMYRFSPEGKLRPQGTYSDLDTMMVVKFIYQTSLFFLTADKARMVMRCDISNNQLSVDNWDIYDFYTYDRKKKTGDFNIYHFRISGDSLFLSGIDDKDESLETVLINNSNVHVN